MKFKVGQKVVAKGSDYFTKGEIVEIIQSDDSSARYCCENNKGNCYWQLESELEPLKEDEQMTFEEKLEKFKSGNCVLNTPTQEIYDKFMVELEKRGYMWGSGIRPTKRREAPIADYGSELCIRNDLHGITYADRNYYVNIGNYRVLKLFLNDFQSSPPTTIVITSDNHHKVTAESNGVTAEAKCSPEDKFSITKGAHMALQRLLEKTKETTKEGGRFHVGDIVEILSTNNDFLKYSIGLQGIITQVNSVSYKVKLPLVLGGSDTWCYADSQLKLIRRAQKDTN